MQTHRVSHLPCGEDRAPHPHVEGAVQCVEVVHNLITELRIGVQVCMYVCYRRCAGMYVCLPSQGLLSHPQTPTRLCVLLRSARSMAIGNSTLTIRAVIFSPPSSARAPACTANFSPCHCEFLRLLFLQAHRETTAHFNATGLPSQQN